MFYSAYSIPILLLYVLFAMFYLALFNHHFTKRKNLTSFFSFLRNLPRRVSFFKMKCSKFFPCRVGTVVTIVFLPKVEQILSVWTRNPWEQILSYWSRPLFGKDAKHNINYFSCNRIHSCCFTIDFYFVF